MSEFVSWGIVLFFWLKNRSELKKVKSNLFIALEENPGNAALKHLDYSLKDAKGISPISKDGIADPSLALSIHHYNRFLWIWYITFAVVLCMSAYKIFIK